MKLDEISFYRPQLMGIATIMILICHMVPFGVAFSHQVANVVNKGNLGVDIFLLLSGIGLYYSLDKYDELTLSGTMKWYRHRYMRILLPYFIMALPYRLILMMIRDYDFKSLLLDISTFTYWTNHKGAWFVALLIPLYIITPMLKKISDMWRIKGISIPMIILVVLSVVWCVFFKLDSDKSNVLYNVTFCMHRVDSFFIGLCIAPMVKQRVQCNVLFLLLFIAIYITLGYSQLAIFVYSLFVLPISLFFAYLLSVVRLEWLHRILRFLGMISLESYLANICLIDMLKGGFVDCKMYGYILIVSFGLLWAYLAHFIVAKLSKN